MLIAVNHLFLWRASLIRQVLKNNRGQIKLAAFDLLNRHTGSTLLSLHHYPLRINFKYGISICYFGL